jgi:RNA polymerase sigma-70 factor (ECF subfamily)
MTGGSASRTSATLLERVCQYPPDEEAWSVFVQRYAGKIHAWCRRWRLREADAEEVTLRVLAKLVEKMRTFTYDPDRSFRAWLKTVTHHAWKDYLRGEHPAALGSDFLDGLSSPGAFDDFADALREEFDRAVLEEAMARVRLRVEEKTWEAFRLLAFEERPGKEVAGRLGMEIAALYMAKSRVQKMLREEIARLEGPDGEPAGVSHRS